jgi:Mg-chelatase subunit ChlD
MIDSTPLKSDAESAFPTLERSERVVILIDVSRSMSQSDYPPTRLQAAKEAALAFVDKKMGIDDSDEVAVVSFSAKGRVVSPPGRVDRTRASLQHKVARLKISPSGTQMGHGLRKAASLLDIPLDIKGGGKGKRGDYLRRIVVLSDGENIAGPDPIETASRLKRSGVVIDTIGIGERGSAIDPGMGLDEKMLRAVASPGRYKYIHDSSTLLIHFEDLAEKVAGEWTNMSGDEVDLPSWADPKAGGQVRLMVQEKPSRLVQVRGAFPDPVVQMVVGFFVGVFGVRYALETAPGSWVLPWLSALALGLIIAWSMRLSGHRIKMALSAPIAFVGALGGYVLALVAQTGSAGAGLDRLTGEPAPHALSLALATVAVGVGLLNTPRQLATRAERLILPWYLWKRRRYAFFRVQAGSPLIGQVCLNEKDHATAFTLGDQLVLCPVCGNAHHVDCWIWNDGHCYGGDTPCPGERPVPSRT